MSRQYQVKGRGFTSDTGTRQRMFSGWGFICETAGGVKAYITAWFGQ